MTTSPHPTSETHHHTSAEDEYLAKRSLRKGSAGWVLLAGFGVSYVISGDYTGWNNGLLQGGVGGLLIATIVIAGMYLAMMLGMAEMSSALPAAIATFLVAPVAAGWIFAACAAFMAYFALHSRKHLVAASPDEEFAALAEAESELT